jgi:SSS family solute:Na+ symporter
MSTMRWPDLVVVLVYLGAMVVVGLRFARRQTSTEAYFVAKRSIPSWAMGISIYAALISSITFVAYPGSAFAGNWNELVPGFMVVGVLILVGLVIIPFFRHAVGMSAYEYFGKRFGYKVRAYSALAFTAGHFSKMGFVIYSLAVTITAVAGLREPQAIFWVILGTGVVTVFYTVIGGLEAVIWTDVIQGFVKCIGIFICLGFLFYLIPGGAGAAFKLAWDNHKFSLGRLDFGLTREGSIWVMSLYGFFWYLQKYTADQTLVQRYLVAKSDRDALKGVALGALLCVPAWALFMLIGTLLWAYYQLSGEVLPAEVAKPDQVFPHFLATKIPAGLAGLFMASLLSAAMSMLSSDLNCLSVVGVEDYYRKLRPEASDRTRLVMGKIIVAVCGAVAVIISMIIALYSNRILDFYYKVTSIIAAGLAGLFLLAFLSPRANRQGAYIGVGACLVFTAWSTLTSGNPKVLDLGRFNFGLHPVMIGVLAHLVLLSVGLVASYFFPPPPEENRAMTLWGWLEGRKGERRSVECESVGSVANVGSVKRESVEREGEDKVMDKVSWGRAG